MKNRKLLLIGAGCIVVVLVTVMLWEPMDTKPVSQNKPLSLSVEKQAKLKSKAAIVERAQASGDTHQVAAAIKDFAEELGGRAGKMLSIASDRNLPVKMYGRVVDQHGQPVAGAKVQMVISGGGAFAPGTGRTFFMTDTDGRFEVAGKGQGLSILNVEHPQLSAVYFKRLASGRKDRGVGFDAAGTYGEEASWRTYNTPEKPYVIPVWRVEKFEKVIVKSGAYDPKPNGKTFEYAGMVTSCSRELMEPHTHWKKQKGSWSITFQPINGGIQETNDFYLNKAPEDGYQSELTVSMERGSPDYKVAIYQPKYYYYYYLQDNKRIYGSFEAEFFPYTYKDKCRVTVKSVKYNPGGTRNLATRKRRY